MIEEGHVRVLWINSNDTIATRVLIMPNTLALSIARAYKEVPTEALPLLLFDDSILALQPDGGPYGAHYRRF
jgi:hypothetical protein